MVMVKIVMLAIAAMMHNIKVAKSSIDDWWLVIIARVDGDELDDCDGDNS